MELRRARDERSNLNNGRGQNHANARSRFARRTHLRARRQVLRRRSDRLRRVQRGTMVAQWAQSSFIPMSRRRRRGLGPRMTNSSAAARIKRARRRRRRRRRQVDAGGRARNLPLGRRRRRRAANRIGRGTSGPAAAHLNSSGPTGRSLMALAVVVVVGGGRRRGVLAVATHYRRARPAPLGPCRGAD